MSYSIIYDRFFIKVNDEVIVPMILAGDNNCYETDRKRSRSWSPYGHFVTNGVYTSIKEITEKLGDIKSDLIKNNTSEEEIEVLNRFGYYSGLEILGRSKLTYSAYRSYVLNACKEAYSFDEIKDSGVGLSIGVSYYSHEKITDKGLPILDSVAVHSEDEFWAAMALHTLTYGGLKYTCIELIGEYAIKWCKRNRKNNRILKSKVETMTITADLFYVLYYPMAGGYYKRGTKRGFHYAYTPGGGKTFLTKKQADAYLNKLKCGHALEVKEINERGYVKVKRRKREESLRLF